MFPQDQLIRKSDGMLPVHLAALTGQHKMVHDFTSQIQLDNMDYQDIQKLFFTTVSNNMFDVAMKLFKKYPLQLTTARDEEKLTALHMLARKPSEILRGSISMGMELLKKLWLEVRKLKNDKFVKLITEPSAVLFDSIKSGNVKGTKYLLDKSREPVMTIKEPKTGRNLLHLLVLYRHFDSFLHCLNCGKEHLVRAVDNEANNVLHMAAHHPPQFRSFSGLRANLQMQRELAWFKKVERNVPRELRSVRNKEGKRPIDVFYDEHKQLSEEIKGEAKDMANYGMLVAILVATVAFAAVLTVPGDKNNAWFIVFILTNAVALFTSSASILSFLSNFTSSRFSQSEFVISIHPSLTLGRVLLIISVAAMVVAFTAASFLIFHQKTKWVSYVVASMGVFPLLLFLLFQFSVFDFIWSRYYPTSKLA
ncbi:hypothetical protein PHAVU_008G204400 [Phaseolus vulgaris]|uniref:PGG domain-containing protein n=1 Tax=Phaseolus vulgaris TaxID=3885 RepID=V7B6S5_PHAVU|nr:hypothetical protein PHAVU_008G204400g [Phaseolus vulgaris]ESW13529.1 hypothetical protein PHAVU_008G204400g [Phaseolus vulgaris]